MGYSIRKSVSAIGPRGGGGGVTSFGGGGLGAKLQGLNPYDTSHSKKIAKEGDAKAQQQYAEGHDISEKMGSADDQYAQDYENNAGAYSQQQDIHNAGYKADLSKLESETADQSSDAKKQYTNTIQPRLKGIMEDAGREAKGAMTLQQAGDPNNKIQTQTRAMYDEQGQKAQKQGMADFGVMSALGAQAAGNQFGSGQPMTSGAMGQIYGQNQQQAGNAYASAQGRMHDLQQRGIDRGYDESNKQYDRGQGAKDRYSKSIGDIDAAESSYQGKTAKLRDERGGYSGERFGIDSNANADRLNMAQQGAGIKQQAAFGRGERDLAGLGQRYGYEQQGITNRIGIEEGARAGKIQTINKEQENGGKVMSSAAGGATSAGSDERLKHGIKPIKDGDLDEFFNAVKPKSYKYNDPDAPGQQDGERMGFMMQDVEDTKLGKSILRPGPDGKKYYDKDNLQGIIMAGLAKQAKRA